jgi:hypothetical protein
LQSELSATARSANPKSSVDSNRSVDGRALFGRTAATPGAHTQNLSPGLLLSAVGNVDKTAPLAPYSTEPFDLAGDNFLREVVDSQYRFSSGPDYLHVLSVDSLLLYSALQHQYSPPDYRIRLTLLNSSGVPMAELDASANEDMVNKHLNGGGEIPDVLLPTSVTGVQISYVSARGFLDGTVDDLLFSDLPLNILWRAFILLLGVGCLSTLFLLRKHHGQPF